MHFKMHKNSVRNPRRIAFLCSFFDKMSFPHFDPFFKMPITLAAVGITGIAFLVVLAGIFICQGGISRSVIAIRRWRTRDKVNTGVL